MINLRSLKYLALAAATAIGLVGTLFVLLIHPDDSRISKFKPTKLAKHAKKKNSKRLFRLFSSSASFHFGPKITKYPHPVSTLRNETGSYVENESKRFTHPLQFYISLGSYPNNLTGKDAMLIPAGHIFNFYPKIRAEFAEIEFSVSSHNGKSRLSLSSSQVETKAIQIHPSSKAVNYKSFMYRNWLRYIAPDGDFGGGIWQDFNTSLALTEDKMVTLTCQGPGDCLVSEPQIWVKNNDLNKNNLIFILVDTLRHDALNPIDSPNLSKLKKNGVSFTNAIASGNMTSPSTNSLLSCKTPSTLGKIAFSYSVDRKTREAHYSKREESFPNLFRNSGWQTAMIGNVSILSEVLGSAISHGFEHQQAIEREAYDTPQITRTAQQWLNDHGDKPFFLYLHYHAPHAPYRAPLRDIFASFPGISVFSSYHNILKWLYRAEIQFTDRYLADLFKTVHELGLEKTTTIVVSSDHGDHHEVRHFIDNEIGKDEKGSYFDHGATLFQDEIRVPLIISGPNFETPSTVPYLVSHLDLAPSLLSAFKIPIPKWCEGHSFLKENSGTENIVNAVSHSQAIGFEGFKRRGIIVSQRLKYIRQYEPVKKRLYSENLFTKSELHFYKKELLFDLKNDPGELFDLSVTEPKLLRTMRKEFQSFYRSKELFEFIVDNPSMHKLNIQISSTTTPQQYHDGKRIVYVQDKPFHPLPVARLSGLALTVKFTKLALPLTMSQEDLPIEIASTSMTLPLGKKSRAYIRRVEASDSHQREILPSNPDFEDILREWGYLNDEQ